jgi:hypothetical protein
MVFTIKHSYFSNDQTCQRFTVYPSKMPKRKKDSQGAIAPLTAAEQERIRALLGTVSTRTLLRSLGRMKWQNDEAGLIITTLLDRVP